MALTNAERATAHRARQQEKLARSQRMEAALREIIAGLADTKTTKGLALRKIAEAALAEERKAS